MWFFKWFRGLIKANRDIKAARQRNLDEYNKKRREIEALHYNSLRDGFTIKRERKLKKMAEERAYRDNIQVIADHIRETKDD